MLGGVALVAIGFVGAVVLTWWCGLDWELGIGLPGLLCMFAGALGLAWVPADPFMGDAVRILHLLGPLRWSCIAVFLVSGCAALGGLLTGRRVFDAVAVATCETGIMLNLALVGVNALLSHAIWNRWWVSDPRFVTFWWTLVFFSAVVWMRRTFVDPDVRQIRTAVAIIIGLVSVPVLVVWVSMQPRGCGGSPAIIQPLMKQLLRTCICGMWMICVWFIARRTRIALQRDDTARLPNLLAPYLPGGGD